MSAQTPAAPAAPRAGGRGGRRPPRRPRLLVRNAWVLTMDAEGHAARLDLRIEQGRIVAMAPRLPARAIDQLIEAEGLVACPGLVQAHTQLGHSLLRGGDDGLDALGWLEGRAWPWEGALDEAATAASARLGIAELLLGGTTAALDVGPVHHAGAVFAAAAALGLRYSGGRSLLDLGHTLPPALRVDAAAGVAESVALLQRWHDAEGGRLRYAMTPQRQLSCSDALLQQSLRAARAHGVRWQVRVAESAQAVQAARRTYGHGPVEHLQALGCLGPDVVLAHGVWLSASEQGLLRDSGAHVVHCPGHELALGAGVARLDDYLAAGVQVALGCGSAAAGGSLDGFATMRLTALLQRARGDPAALSAARALQLATRGGARALGLDDCGSLELGKRADLVLLDLQRPPAWPGCDAVTRLVFGGSRQDVHTVIVDGQAVVQGGTLLTASVGEIDREARQAQARQARAVAAAGAAVVPAGPME